MLCSRAELFEAQIGANPYLTAMVTQYYCYADLEQPRPDGVGDPWMNLSRRHCLHFGSFRYAFVHRRLHCIQELNLKVQRAS